MFTPREHLDNLVRHITLVREACILLGERLMDSGRLEFGRLLIAGWSSTRCFQIFWY